MHVIVVSNKETLIVEEVVGIFLTEDGAKSWAQEHYIDKDFISYSIERIQNP